MDRFYNPVFLFEQIADRFRLAIAKFQHDSAARMQPLPRSRRKHSVEIKPIGPAVQRLAGFEVLYFGLQGRDLTRWDVGGVGDEQVKALVRRDSVESAPLDEPEPILDSAARQTSYGLPYEPVNLGAGSVYKIFTTATAMVRANWL